MMMGKPHPAGCAGHPPRFAGKDLSRRERQFARRFERELGRDLALMFAGELERRDLDGPVSKSGVTIVSVSCG